MNFQSLQTPELLKKFTKCGYIYKSPAIGHKHHLLLTCFYCNEVFWQLENYLEHSVNHLETRSAYAGIAEEDSLDIEASILKTETKIQCQSEPLIAGAPLQTQESSNRKDPLEEEGSEFLDILTENIKTENIEKLGSSDGNFVKEKDSLVDEGNDSDVDLEPDKCSVDDVANNGDYSDNDSENGSDNNGLHDNLAENDNIDDTPHNQEINLKRLTKNRSFIRFIIQIYKQEITLWETTTKSRSSAMKLQALTAIAYEINNKFNINVTTKQVEMIIKRLRMRFIHQYRLNQRCSDNASDHCSKPLWFYDQLKFLEPHIKGCIQKTSICGELTDGQLLILIRLLKENDCFWNEDNIYHTSVIYKQESLKEIVNSYALLCDQHYFTVNDMRNVIEELKDVVVNENRHRLEYLESHTTGLYIPQHRFYKDLEFLSVHVGPFRCSQCGKSFLDIYSYKFHVSKHEGTKPFKCMVCHKELTHKKEFMCHLRRHTKECPFKCELCDKSFPSKKERQRHVIKHGSKPYVCELCADSFYTQHQLTNHMKNHANIRDHVCAQCGKGFTHRGLLRQHLQTHNKTECVCKICNNVYANPRSLRKHYVRVHETSQEASASNHSCKICMITFPSVQEAKQHRKEHKQSLPVKRKHVCDICGHDFAYPRNLADHKKTHSNVRDQVCDVCGKAFTNANLLNQHKNVHNGQKFVCKVCGKDYAHYRGLCRHISKAHNSCVKDLNSEKDIEQCGESPQLPL